MRKFSKPILIVTSVLLLLVMSFSALAAPSNNALDEMFYSETPSRGDYPPTLRTTLPYTTGVSVFSSYTITSYMFTPGSSGTLYVAFSGSISSGGGTSKLTVKLYRYYLNSYDVQIGEAKSLGTADAWPASGIPNVAFTDLLPGAYYYVRFEKTNSNYITGQGTIST